MIVLTLLLGLFQLVVNAYTDTQIDFTESLEQCNLPLLQRVTKKVKINYNFNLYGPHWSQFPDMNIEIDLPYAQYVKVKYNVCVVLSASSYFASRLLVDGVIDDQYTGHNQNVLTPCLFRMGEIHLTEGKHHLIVQYRTAYPRYNLQWDWNHNFFKVQYNRKVSNS